MFTNCGSVNRKIWHLVSSIEAVAAGPSYSVPSLCSSLTEKGDDVTLASIGTSITTQESAYFDARFPQSVENNKFLSMLGYSRQLQNTVRSVSRDIDVLHLHGLWMLPNLFPRPAIQNASLCKIVTPRGMLDPAALKYSKRKKMLFWHIAQKRTLQAAHCIHATSEKERDDIRRMGVSRPIAVIPNGIDIPVLQKFVRPADKTIVFIGRLHHKKGLDNLIDAWSGIYEEFPSWTIKVFGPGDEVYIQSLQRKITSRRLERISIHRPVYGATKQAIFQSAEFSILPTFGENFGLTVAESLAVETPVITTKFTPWQGLVRNECGWVCSPTSESIREALKAAMNCSSSERNAMGQRGRKWMETDFAWHTIAQDISEMYEWVLAGTKLPEFVEL